jgi:FkbM family methyltransferase
MKSGSKLSINEEEALLKSVQSAQGFVGIIPLRCKLGEYYFLNLDDDHVAEHLFWLGCFGYERSSAVLFTHLAMEADYVLDLGSYSGYFSVLSSVLANNSNTFAVEANPLNFHRLCENLRINGSDAAPYHCALTPSSDTQETIKIFYDANLRVLDTGSFALHELAEIIPQKRNKRHSFIVPAISFPSLMKELSIPVSKKNESYALIKLDVEGLEAPLLSDIAGFFSDSKFIVLIEILTVEAYKSILSVVHSHHDLSIAYINEHEQEISLRDHSEYSRQKGSRNFILGSKRLIQNICNLSPGKLLEKFE